MGYFMSNLGNRSKGAGTDARQNRRASRKSTDTTVIDELPQKVDDKAVTKAANRITELPNINEMRKADLIDHAVSLGVGVSDSMTVKEIKAALGE